MRDRPKLHRSPRFFPSLPSGQKELRLPEAPPEQTQESLATRLMPGLIGGALTLVVSALTLVGRSGSMEQTVVTLLLGALGTVGSQLYKDHLTSCSIAAKQRVRVEKYIRYLAATRRELESVAKRQATALLTNDPSFDDCLRRVRQLDRRVWERTSKDPDFLALRVGLGARPLSLTLEVPNVEETPDSLVERAVGLQHEFAQVAGVPIVVSLERARAVGIVGPPGPASDLARSVLAQLVTHHSPEDVRLVAITESATSWQWLRWLPHLRSEGGGLRLFGWDPPSSQAALGRFLEVLKRRQKLLEGTDEKAAPPLPRQVLFLTSPEPAQGDPALALALKSGRELGAAVLMLAQRSEELPRSCQVIVRTGPSSARAAGPASLPALTPRQPSKTESAVVSVGQATGRTPFLADAVSIGQADQLARAMAPLEQHAAGGGGQVRAGVSLMELLGVRTFEELELEARWRTHKPFQSMAIPVGVTAGDKPLVFDLHETGHGPHGLVAGTTGSGKTVFMTTVLGLLAANFHPHEVSFVCIDYKGGDLFRGLEDLPHLVGTLTNLERSLIWRALRALQAENERRMRLFSEATASTGTPVNKIDDYQRLTREGKTTEPLAKLLIVCDEFAELAKQQPEFIEKLVSTARVGRSLGVHLILATQQPAGIINDQIWGNTRFRMCFRFGRNEDSKAVLKRPEAAAITQSGRGYFQVGENEVFELFQGAWGGMEYVAASGEQAAPGIREVALDGSTRPLGREAQATAREAARQRGPTQLQVLTGKIAEFARGRGIRPLPGPWLPSLETRIPLARIRPDRGWDGQRWRPASGALEPVVGMVDDPARHAQGPHAVAFGRDGHLAVFGRPSSGLTTALQTLVVSAALERPPDEVQVYLVDFAGRMLRLLKALPHVGDAVEADEPEKAGRLFAMLSGELALRKERFGAVGARSLEADYLARQPLSVLVLDDFQSLQSQGSETTRDLLARLLKSAKGPGLHLLLTGNTSDFAFNSFDPMARTLAMFRSGLLLGTRDDGGVLGSPRIPAEQDAFVPGDGFAIQKGKLQCRLKAATPGSSAAALAAWVARIAQRWPAPVSDDSEPPEPEPMEPEPSEPEPMEPEPMEPEPTESDDRVTS